MEQVSAGHMLAFGHAVSWARPMLRALQRVVKETVLPFIIIGTPIVLLVSRRRAVFILMVPLYFFVAQGLLHTEFRYTLPMHYFLFVFAAVTWVLIGAGISTAVKRVFRERRANEALEARP